MRSTKSALLRPPKRTRKPNMSEQPCGNQQELGTYPLESSEPSSPRTVALLRVYSVHSTSVQLSEWHLRFAMTSKREQVHPLTITCIELERETRDKRSLAGLGRSRYRKTSYFFWMRREYPLFTRSLPQEQATCAGVTLKPCALFVGLGMWRPRCSEKLERRRGFHQLSRVDLLFLLLQAHQ